MLGLKSLPEGLRKLALPAVALPVVVAVATGFPARVGATKADADLSMPGDLVLPAATVVADQVRTFSAEPEDLWLSLLSVEELFSRLWGLPLEVVYEARDQLLVWEAVGGASQGDATVAAVLQPRPDRKTAVHLRQRYHSEGHKQRMWAHRQRLFTGLITPVIWRYMRPLG